LPCSPNSKHAPARSPNASTGSGGFFDLASRKERLQQVDELAAEPSLWEDTKRAQALLREQRELQDAIASVERPLKALEEARMLIELGEEADDESVFAEIRELNEAADSAAQKLELRRMLGGPIDKNNAILHINCGAGGTESADWAGMLLRMYLRYCDQRGWTTSLVDEQAAEEAGIKSATVEVIGEYAYGMLRAEIGVHRLVRISPFDSAARRHTSFASVFVYPEVDDDIDIVINDVDLKVDTYRSGGAGGQHVNKTESAVRITHMPSGIIVACQSERSQIANRAKAMKMLKARMYDAEIQRRQSEADAVNDTKQSIAFGSQIRSYVLHPYRMVKDHRTDYEVGNADSVLEGNLEGFIESYLMQQATAAEA
jgi:peptide chain release factor 2